MNQMENEEEVWKLGSVHENVGNEYETEDGNCEDNGVEIGDRNCEQCETAAK